MLLWSFVYKFCADLCFHFVWNRSGIAGSYGDPMFSPLRNHQTVLQSSCTILHYPQQWCGFNSSTSLPKLIICRFDYSHPGGCELVAHFVVLIWITLKANDVSICSHAYWPLCMFFREMCIKILKSWIGFVWFVPITCFQCMTSEDNKLFWNAIWRHTRKICITYGYILGYGIMGKGQVIFSFLFIYIFWTFNNTYVTFV